MLTQALAASALTLYAACIAALITAGTVSWRGVVVAVCVLGAVGVLVWG